MTSIIDQFWPFYRKSETGECRVLITTKCGGATGGRPDLQIEGLLSRKFDQDCLQQQGSSKMLSKNRRYAL